MTVVADTLADAYKAQRDYLANQIQEADVTSASDENIQNGYQNLFQKSYYGPSVFSLWDFYDDSPGNRAWVSALTKTANKSKTATPDPHTEYALLTQKAYYDVWGLNKRFYVPAQAVVHFHVTCDLVSPVLNNWGVNYRMPQYSGGTASEAFIFIDGTKIDVTKGLSFEEKFTTPPTGEAAIGITSSSNNPSRNWIRRYYSCFYQVTLDEGWHEISFKVDCRNERTYAGRRSLLIDGTYR